MVKAGKPAKVAIVAIMRKLLILANALIRDGENPQPRHLHGSPREGPESAPSPKGPSPPFQTTATRSATGHPRRDIFGDPF